MLCWATPLFLVMIALMARSIAADPLSGICTIGAASKVVFPLLGPSKWAFQVLDSVFNLFRDLIILIACVIPLLIGCPILMTTQQPNQNSYFSGFIVGCLYIAAALFYIVSSAHDIVQPGIHWGKTWNVVSAFKTLIDPILGVVAATCCLIFVVKNLLSNNR